MTTRTSPKKHETRKSKLKCFAVVTVVDDGGDARTAPKASVWLCLANFLEGFGTNNTVNIDVFGASQAKNNGMRKVFEFFAVGSNNHGIYSVFVDSTGS